MSVPAPTYSKECELVMIRLNLTNSILTPAPTEYGINSLKVTVVNPALVGSVALSTVNKIGSVFTVAVAPPPPEKLTVRF